MTANAVAFIATAQVAEASDELVFPAYAEQPRISSSPGPIAEFKTFREAVGDNPNKMTTTQQTQYLDLQSKARAENNWLNPRQDWQNYLRTFS